MKPSSLVPIVAAAAMLSIELAEGFTAPASLAASQLRSHSLQVRAAAAADSSQYLVDYMVRAQDEKLKAIESTKAAVAQEYEARLAAMEARLQQLSAGTQPKAAAVAAPAAPAAAVAAAPAAPVKSASQAVGYAPAGPDKRIEDYRAEMAEFLLTVQRERLQSMDTLRRELTTAYDEQVADVQAQIAQLNAPVASAAAAAAKPVAAAAPVAAPQTHPAYIARQQRQGWTDRWGDSETARLGVAQAAAAVTAPPAAAVAAKPVTAAVAAAQVHPAYIARQQRQGWSDRWGDSETARMGVQQAVAPAVSAVAAAVVVPQQQQQSSSVHPAYAARLTRQGWQDRWGASETLRIAAEAITSADSSSTTATAAAALPANVHPAYAARLHREDWSGRWGAEESLRVSAVADSSTAATATDAGDDVAEVTRQLEELRSYLQLYIARSGEERSKLTGRLDAANSRADAAAEQLIAVRASYEAYAASSLEHRTAAVAAARAAALREAAASTGSSSSKVNGSSSSGSGSGSAAAAAPIAAVQPAAAVAAVAAVPLNAAYVARNTRPGLSSRWGAEELQRVAAASK
jgi:trimeric autotransporter adhesin